MDKQIKQKAKRIFAAILALTITTGTLPYTPLSDVVGDVAITASAAEYTQNPTTKDELVPLASSGTVSEAHVVKYANKEWYVIGYDGVGLASESGTMTLFLKGTLGKRTFSDNGSNVYGNSSIHSYLESYLANTENFTSDESGAVVTRVLSGGGPTGNSNSGHVSGDSVNAKLWLLSAAEARKIPQSIIKSGGDGDGWWLRSPGGGSSKANYMPVSPYGTTDSPKESETDIGYSKSIRAAMLLDLNSVIYSSETNTLIAQKAESHSITVSLDNDQGSVEAPSCADKGETVSFTIATAVGYEVDTVKFNDTPISPLNGVYSFTMPDNDVTISVTFNQIYKVEDHIEQDGDTYTIKTAKGWEVFCDCVKSSAYNGFGNKTVKLGLDITDGVTVSAGIPGKPFLGTFDGDGHTLAVALNSTDEEWVAPFSFFNGSIKNLTVTGTIAGSTYAAGLTGFTYGGSIENVTVSADVSGSSKIGGITGYSDFGSLLVKDTVFNGTLQCNKDVCGLIGWASENVGYNQAITIENCLFNGTYTCDGEFHPITLRNSNSQFAYTDNGAYYTVDPKLSSNNYIICAGTRVSTINVDDDFKITANPTFTFNNVDYYAEGTTITLSRVGSVTGVSVNNGSVEVTDNQDGTYSFTMPAEDVTINGHFSINIDSTIHHGSVTVTVGTTENAVAANEGDTVTLTVTPKTGYEVGTLTVRDSSNNVIEVNNNQFTMPASDVTVSATFTPDSAHFSQSGNTYTIHDATGWDIFCDMLADGESFSGKTVKLSDSFSDTVTRAAGTREKPFKGTFDGNEKTLNVNMSDTTNQGTAPFRAFGGGALIKNLTVTGKVNGGLHSAGLVGFSEATSQGQTNTIENCTVSVAVINPVTSGNRHIGGVVGHGLSSSLTIKNTVWNGSMSNSGNYAGGLMGWCDSNASLTLENCISIGTFTGTASGGFHPVAIMNKDSTITHSKSNCYYTTAPTLTNNTYIAESGEQAYAAASDSYTKPFTVRDITVYVSCPFSGSGTQNDPYIIGTADDWNAFCDCLNNNDLWNRFSGKTVALEKDITVSRMAGTSKHDFCGTFEGSGKTLIFTSRENVNGAAPFSYVSETTPTGGTAVSHPVIRNLNVVCDITTSETHASGLVGRMWGTLTIENCTVSGTITSSNKYACGFIGEQNGTAYITNCRSSVEINSSVSGDGTHGGFIGRTMNNTSTCIEGCVFDGKIVSTGTGDDATTSCGGFVGWRDKNGSLTITNSLYTPTADDNAVADGATFARNWTMPDNANCYYTSALGTAQGKQAYKITSDEDVTLGLSGTPTEYDVSGITAYAGNSGIRYGNTFYAGSGDTVALELNYTGTPAAGYIQNGYTASAGTLSGTTLTMPAENVTINADVDVESYFDASTGTLTLKGIVENGGIGQGIILPEGVSKTDVQHIVVDPAGATLPQDSSWLFYRFTSVKSIDLRGADTSKVQNMNNMFANCRNLTSLDLSSFDTSSVTDISYMFYDCENLTTLDLSSFNTSKVRNMDDMFYFCKKLITLDLSSFNTGSVTNMNSMFGFCSKLTTIYVSDKWDAGSVTNSGNMFSGCSMLTGGNNTAFDGNHTDKTYARIDKDGQPGYLTGVYTLTLPDDLEMETDADEDMKVGIGYLKGAEVTLRYTGTVPTGHYLTVNVNGTATTAVNGVCTITIPDSNAIVTTETIDAFDESTGTLTLKGTILQNGQGINLPEGVEKYDVRQIVVDSSGATLPQDSSYLFFSFSNVESIDLTGADTSSVTNMGSMFSDCIGLQTIDLSGFDTSSVTNMSLMFYRCKMTELDLSGFDTSQVTYMSSMFGECKNLTTLDLSSFDTRLVNGMYAMFQNCTGLETIYVGEKWNTDSVSSNDSSYLFDGCTKLTGGSGTAYDSNYTDKTYAVIDKEGQPGYLTGVYTMTLPDNVTASPVQTTINGTKYYAQGKIITLTAPKGYIIKSVTVMNGTASVGTTDNNDGTYSFTMPAGEVVVTAELEEITQSYIVGASLTLTGDISVNLYMNFSKALLDDSGAYMLIKGPNDSQPVKYLLSDLKNDDGKYVARCRVNAAQMGENVTFELYNGSNEKQTFWNTNKSVSYTTFTYSVNSYINAVKNGNDKLAKLAFAMQNYGAWASKYLTDEGKISNVAEIADPTLIEDVTTSDLEAYAVQKSEGFSVSNLNMSLFVESETTIRLYYTGDPITVTATRNGDTLDVYSGTKNKNYVEVRNISAKDLGKTITFDFGTAGTVEVSVLSYAYAILNAYSGNENKTNICNTVKALYKYYEAANEYFE